MTLVSSAVSMSARQLVRRARDVDAAAVLRPIRRLTRNPFAPGQSARLLLHCCHHKTGTAWSRAVLHAVAGHYGLRFEIVRGHRPHPGTAVVLKNDSQIDVATLPDFLGSHMIRDPRDVVVSAYFYHLWTKEAWAHEPSPEYGGLSYQAYLCSLPREEGLLAEIRHSLPVIEQMARWDYTDPRFLELRYEDAIADETTTFTALFRHYGFNPDAVATSVGIARRFSFERLAGRRLGEASEGSHLRSGQPGQWREVFNDEHGALFKEVAGLALVAIGYETDNRW